MTKELTLRMHAFNYVVKESGIRDFCGKCAACCTICNPKTTHNKTDISYPNDKTGCRNVTCLFYVCTELRDALDNRNKFGSRDGTLSLLTVINNCRPFEKTDLAFVRKTAKRVTQGTFYRLERISVSMGNKSIKDKQIKALQRKLLHKQPITPEFIKLAKEFDKTTERLFP